MAGNGLIGDFRDLEALSPSRIGFFSGSFNPVHDGHIALAERVLEGGLDHVVFVPHSLNPEKRDILVPIAHRIEMILILKNIARFSGKMHVMDPAFIEGTRSEAFTALCEGLAARGSACSIVCGSDMFSRPYYPSLCALDHYIGIRDRVYDEDGIRRLIKGRIEFLATSFGSLSSTQIRSMASQRRMDAIHKSLGEYIRKHDLFGKPVP